MATYEKVQKAKECKKKIRQIVIGYFEEKEDIVPNSGQLKILKELMIRHLAVSTNMRIRKKGLITYLDTRILKDNDEVISFLDCEKNMESFLKSFYGQECQCPKTYKVKNGFPPFLLLDKAHIEMEKAFLEYLNVEGDTDEKDDWKDDEEEFGYKAKKYLEFLYSVAIFEIFLRELYTKLIQQVLQNSNKVLGEEEYRNLDEKWRELEELQKQEKFRDVKKVKVMAEQIVERMGAYTQHLMETNFYFNVLYYTVCLQSHLYAILRMVVLIEFLNITLNSSLKKVEKQNDIVEAAIWERIVLQLYEDGVLDGTLNFYTHNQGYGTKKYEAEINKKDILLNDELDEQEKKNSLDKRKINSKRNLGTLHREFNRFYMENEIFTHKKEGMKQKAYELEFKECFNNIIKYLTKMRNYNENHNSQIAQREMQELVDEISMPVWGVIREITKIQDRAAKERKKKAIKYNRINNDNAKKKEKREK